MLRGGIFDQLGGGFHRYSVDAGWAVPHFEKMLYDNAQLAVVYLHAHQLGRGRRPPARGGGHPRLPGPGDAPPGGWLRLVAGRRHRGRRGEVLRLDRRSRSARPSARRRLTRGGADGRRSARRRTPAGCGRGRGGGARLPRLRGVAGGELRAGAAACSRSPSHRTSSPRSSASSRGEAAARVEGLRAQAARLPAAARRSRPRRQGGHLLERAGPARLRRGRGGPRPS